MIAYFRVDASETIGFGHIVRSLSLASLLKKSSIFSNIVFIINSYPKLRELVSEENFETIILPDKVQEEEFLKNYFFTTSNNLVVFDTLVNYTAEFIQQVSDNHYTVMIHSYSDGRFNCDLAVYPAAHLPESFLKDSKWGNNKLLHGFKYCLLNKEILKYSPRVSIKIPPEKVIFIAGGSDPTNSFLTFYTWIKNYNIPSLSFHFLYGQGCNYSNDIEKYETENIKLSPFHASLLIDADIAVCAFGVSLYELVYLNIPTLSYGHTPLHSEASYRFSDRFGCTIDLGVFSNLTEKTFINKLLSLLNNDNLIDNLKKRCVNLIDGKGLERLSGEILRMIQ